MCAFRRRLACLEPTGNGPDVLTKIAMVGNDMRLDPGIGTCGKDNQAFPSASASRPSRSRP
jgi:predicted Zn-dependent protease